MSYHTNPETGDTGKCSTTPDRCRYKGQSDHYETELEARTAYEGLHDDPFVDPASQRLEEIFKNGYSSQYENKEEIKNLWQEVAGLPLSHDGLLYIGTEKKVAGQVVSSHSVNIYNFSGDKYIISTMKLGPSGGEAGAREVKSDSAEALTFDQAISHLQKVSTKYGVASQAQESYMNI